MHGQTGDGMIRSRTEPQTPLAKQFEVETLWEDGTTTVRSLNAKPDDEPWTQIRVKDLQPVGGMQRIVERFRLPRIVIRKGIDGDRRSFRNRRQKRCVESDRDVHKPRRSRFVLR
jgi:hypothetical protein